MHKLGKVGVYRLNGRLYACSSLYGRHVLIPRHRHLDNWAQAGNAVFAYATLAKGSERFVSRSLKTGQLLHSYVYGTYCLDASGFNPICQVDRLVTNTNGTLGWIIEVFYSGGDNTVEVWKDDSTGATRLDEAFALCQDPTCEQVDTTYLRATTTEIFWKNQNGVQSAPLS